MTVKVAWLMLLLVLAGFAGGCAQWPGDYNPTAAEEQRRMHELEWNLDPYR
ncbi:MAG: hypothetical protein LDL07_09770 [Desulfarculus sp.]|nr:hypothetical protein [Desulfarculus sp.]